MAQVTGGERMDAVLQALRDKLTSAKEVRVGFLEGATYPDGTNVATIAAINNFGAPEAGIPAHPFFTRMIAENSPEWGQKFAAIMEANEYDAAKSLALMGEGMAGQLRESIVSTMEPANSPVTNLLKQRFPTGDGYTFEDVMQARRDVAAGDTAPAGKPLVWSGNLLASVDREVR